MSSVEATFSFTVSHPSSLIGPLVLISAAMRLYPYVIIIGLNTALSCQGHLDCAYLVDENARKCIADTGIRTRDYCGGHFQMTIGFTLLYRVI